MTTDLHLTRCPLCDGENTHNHDCAVTRKEFVALQADVREVAREVFRLGRALGRVGTPGAVERICEWESDK